ncbi:MAG: exodeoxyribonuclease VII small subunit [Verrucomicrobiota bacterium]|nr:exodeoxyribonuclease VII small subunit [Limisphaera sp.]MDW8380995.1 exodeoxyribonuclease VII small subunit [Verrucomicrobiota bacterium]
MAKSAQQEASSTSEDLSFEQVLERLEAIVEAMESGELPLERMLAEYEQGMKLAAICAQKLAEAELKVQELEKTAEGRFRLKPFGTDQPPAEGSPATEPS